jgi:hypothetical protein
MLTAVTVLFGGDLCPLGLSVQFVDAPETQVTAALHDLFSPVVSTPTGRRFPEALEAMLPFQAPWTRTLTSRVGRWTALTNNSVTGGDSTAPGPAIADRLGARCVVATHAPPFGPGHAQTQLEVVGPEGEPPLMTIRSISATATDGRWEWFESGEPFAFEETERYTGRHQRDRFDRPTLLRYLAELGIPVAGDAYGPATLHQQQVTWPSREVTLDEERRLFGR